MAERVDGTVGAGPTAREAGAHERVPSLLGWSLAGFHVALLVVLVVGTLYASGVLGDLLAGLQTWIGVVAYLYLWGVTWWTNRRLLAEVGDDLLRDGPPANPLLLGTMRWGAVTGLLAFLPVLLLEVVLVATAGGAPAFAALALVTVVAAFVSAAVGLTVGVLFALLDLLLLRLARGLTPRDGVQSSEPDALR